jgi:hypothetical protein
LHHPLQHRKSIYIARRTCSCPGCDTPLLPSKTRCLYIKQSVFIWIDLIYVEAYINIISFDTWLWNAIAASCCNISFYFSKKNVLLWIIEVLACQHFMRTCLNEVLLGQIFILSCPNVVLTCLNTVLLFQNVMLSCANPVLTCWMEA